MGRQTPKYSAVIFGVYATPLVATAEPNSSRPGMGNCNSDQLGEIAKRIPEQLFKQCLQNDGTFVCDDKGFACCSEFGCAFDGVWFRRPLPKFTPNFNGGGTLQR